MEQGHSRQRGPLDGKGRGVGMCVCVCVCALHVLAVLGVGTGKILMCACGAEWDRRGVWRLGGQKINLKIRTGCLAMPHMLRI